MATCALSGNFITSTLRDSTIPIGTRLLIFTLTGATFPAAGAAFDAERANILNGVSSDRSDPHGFLAEVLPYLLANLSCLVRTSGTVATLTFPGSNGYSGAHAYEIPASETLTWVVPASSNSSGAPITCTPTRTITFVAPVATTVTVDFSNTTTNGGGTQVSRFGMLNGFSATDPPDNLITALKCLFHRAGSFLRYARSIAFGMLFSHIFSDRWGYPSGSTHTGAKWPYDPTSGFATMLAAEVAADAGLTFRLEPWNEPNNTAFWPAGHDTDFFATFAQIVTAFRAAFPNLIVVGPSIDAYDETYLDAFFTYMLTGGPGGTPVKIDILSFHDNVVDYTVIPTHVAAARSRYVNGATYALIGLSDVEVSEAGGNRVQFSQAGQLSALQQLEIAKVQGTPSNWLDPDGTDNGHNNSIDGMLTPSFQPRGKWWGAKAYADLGLDRVGVTSTQAEVVALAGQSGNIVLAHYAPSSLTTAIYADVTLVLNRLDLIPSLKGKRNVCVSGLIIPYSGIDYVAELPTLVSLTASIVSNSATIHMGMVRIDELLIIGLSASILGGDLFLAELTAYDPSGGGSVKILRYSSGLGFTTRTGETPPDAYYDPRLKQPADIQRSVFKDGATAGESEETLGALVLQNDDSLLDPLLTYGFSGRLLTIRRGVQGGAYPGDFPAVFTGTMEQPEADESTVTIKVNDKQLALQQPLQATKYAGSNVLPAGLEGVETDLKGKPKPVCYGTVKNIALPCVNTEKLIYQANDGVLASIEDVRDSGISLAPRLYVAVGDTGKLFTSPDRVTWTSRTSGFGTSRINGIAFGNGVFVAVGAAGKIFTSTVGISGWTSRSNPFPGTDDIFSVAFAPELGLFVAGGANDRIITSPDGTTWTNRTSSFSGGTAIQAIAWSPLLRMFMAVASASVGKIASSPDGVTWTQRTSGITAGMAGAVWSPDLKVFAVAGTNGTVSTSPDAVTFTLKTGLSITLNGIAAGNGGFLAVGTVGAVGQAAFSPDGDVWTLRALTDLSTVSIQTAAYLDNDFLIGSAAGLLGFSPDGQVFTKLQAAFGANTIYGMVLGLNVGAVGTYANSTDLLDDTLAPAAGTYKVYLAGGYIRLGSPPAGQVTADVTEGATAADRTTAQIFARILDVRAGLTTGDWLAADITALDALNSAVIGFWTAEETTFADVLDQVASSIGAGWGTDANGVYRIQQLLAPSGTASCFFTEHDLLAPIKRLVTSDPSRGLPTWKSIVRYAQNYTVQDTGLAGGVTDDRRAFVALQWREATAQNTGVQTAHLLAVQTAEDSLLATVTDAQAEATRRQALRGVLRNLLELVVPWNAETDVLDIFGANLIQLTHPRYNLSGGVLMRVLGIKPDGEQGRLTLTVWY
ncbi:MAG TPA: WD40 repeat domain-containing protein [Reyranella sp.]|nr:WD40 repeat domain-containing protein [Reyranella sp.]